MLGWFSATFTFLKFFVFFWFFPLKLVYFWTKNRKNIYGCFFHSFCATDLNFDTKNNGRLKLSTLKTLIFTNFDLRFRIEPNLENIHWQFSYTLGLAYSPLNSATLSYSSVVTLMTLVGKPDYTFNRFHLVHVDCRYTYVSTNTPPVTKFSI